MLNPQCLLVIRKRYTSLFLLRFAWTSPSSLEPWIEKRLTPLSKDTVPHTPVDKLIGTKHIPDDILDSHNESFKAKQG